MTAFNFQCFQILEEEVHNDTGFAMLRMAFSAMLLCVPCEGALLSPVKIRAGKLSLQPEALGAGQEATNGLKHFEKRPL